GAGEGSLAERAENLPTGLALGAGIGAAAPPVIAGVGRAIGAVGSTAGRLASAARRPSEPPLAFNAGPRPSPIEGAQFVSQRSPEEIAGSQTRVLDAIRDTLLREGTHPAQIEAQLNEFA